MAHIEHERMNLKLIILGALAYTLFLKPKTSQATDKVAAPTQAEVNAKMLELAKQAQETAQQVLSSI